MHTLSKGPEKMTESMRASMGMDALASGLRSAARRCRRSAARQGTRGRRGARSVGPYGLPWAMYRETMKGVRAVYEIRPPVPLKLASMMWGMPQTIGWFASFLTDYAHDLFEPSEDAR